MSAEPIDTPLEAPTERSALPRLADLGAAAQASVPGLYAWAVTVAPSAFSRGAGLVARIGAILGLGAIVAAVVLERRRSPYGRVVLVWGLPMASVVVWLASSAMLSPLRMDAPRGLTGVVGWLLFALAAGGPALGDGARAAGRAVEGPKLTPRSPIRRGDVLYIGAAVAVAVLLQGIGWQVPAAERGLLVRLVTLAAGIALVGSATTVALARHSQRSAPGPLPRRIRAALPWIAALLMLAVGAFVVGLR
jgi:hypothetical protein